MLNKQISFFILVFILSVSEIFAQNVKDTLSLTVEKAVTMAVDNNPDIKRVQLGNQLLETQIAQAKSAGLPQVTGSAGFTDNFSIASQILPGEIFGQTGEIAVQFGTRYGLNAGVEINQLLYSREYRTNLNKLDATKHITQLQVLSTMEDLVYNVVQVYIQYQTTAEQQKLLYDNLDRIDQLVEISNAQYENGIIKKLDVDQIKVNRTNQLTNISNLNTKLEQQLNVLRFYLNLDRGLEIVLSEKLDNTSQYPLSSTLMLSQNINYQILNDRIELTKLEDEVIKAGYYPTVSAFAQYNYTGQANKLNFKSDNYTDFTAGLYGLTVSIPIFDGFNKKNKLAENKILYEQQKLDLQTLKNNTKLEFNNANANLKQNQNLINTQLENMDLATMVYDVTKLSYQEGVAALTDLIDAENGLEDAQSQYLTALINYKLAELDHIKASGQLAQLLSANN